MTQLEKLADSTIRIFQLKSGITLHASCWGEDTNSLSSPYRGQPLDRIITVAKTNKKSIKKYKKEFKKCTCNICDQKLISL